MYSPCFCLNFYLLIYFLQVYNLGSNKKMFKIINLASHDNLSIFRMALYTLYENFYNDTNGWSNNRPLAIRRALYTGYTYMSAL